MIIYVIGSLRNPKIPDIANVLRQDGHDVFDDWWSGSEDADEWWQKHEQIRGRSYAQALVGHHARHVFEFDKAHLDRADVGVLILPAGKSAHLELGYLVGRGKPAYVLFDGEPERFDVMYLFATKACFSLDELLVELNPDGPKLRTVDHAPWNA